MQASCLEFGQRVRMRGDTGMCSERRCYRTSGNPYSKAIAFEAARNAAKAVRCPSALLNQPANHEPGVMRAAEPTRVSSPPCLATPPPHDAPGIGCAAQIPGLVLTEIMDCDGRGSTLPRGSDSRRRALLTTRMRMKVCASAVLDSSASLCWRLHFLCWTHP